MPKITKVSKQLALARLNTLSDNIKIHVGSTQTYSKKDIITHIRKETKIGQEMVNIQIEFLKDLAHGKLYEDD